MLKIENNHYYHGKTKTQFLRGLHGPLLEGMESEGFWLGQPGEDPIIMYSERNFSEEEFRALDML